MDLINNRIIPSIIIFFTILISYSFNLDTILFLLILMLCFLDLFYSNFFSSKISKIFFVLCILLFLIFNFYNFELDIYFIPLFIILLLLTFVNTKNIKELFVVIICLYIFIIYIFISNDRDLFYFLLIVSFINDTTAYIIGKNFKGPLIFPSVSPNKTWSGTCSSFILTFLIFIYLDYHLILSFFVSTLFFFGDLYFSFIKRKLNIKDFSKSLLGHGGILDRLDSMFFVFFLFYVVRL